MGRFRRQPVPSGPEASALLRLMMLAGMVSLWVMMLDWPEMTSGRLVSCAAAFIASCAMALVRAASHRDADGSEGWFLRSRAAAKLGMPLPAPGTPFGSMYRYGAAWLLFDMLTELAAAYGFLLCMPWGWFAAMGRYAIRAVISIMRQAPTIKGDKESEDALEVAQVMSQATVAAAIVMAAWLSS